MGSRTALAPFNTGSSKVRVAIDEIALTGWMATNIEGFRGPLSVQQFNGRQSKPTYRVTTPRAAKSCGVNRLSCC